MSTEKETVGCHGGLCLYNFFMGVSERPIGDGTDILDMQGLSHAHLDFARTDTAILHLFDLPMALVRSRNTSIPRVPGVMILGQGMFPSCIFPVPFAPLDQGVGA